MTNEQLVASAEDRVSQLKQEYVTYLSPIAIKVAESNVLPSASELLRCQQLGNEYFNYLETFVGRSGLLGAHANGLWVTGFAETCYSVLNAYLVHINFLRSYKEVFGNVTIEPDPYAFANMQRMVREYFPKESVDALAKKFEDNQLPVQGFVMPAHEDIRKIPTWQIVASMIIGLVGAGGVASLSIMIPEPTAWQEFVFRACLALALAAIAVIVPGFLNVNARVKGWGNYVKVVAGGAIAIFVIIWLINPPQISTTAKPSGTVSNESIQPTAGAAAD